MAHTGAVLLMKVKQEAPDLDTFMNGAQTCSGTVSASAGCLLPMKTEPCNLPDTPLDSPGSSNSSDTHLSSSPGPSKPNNRNSSDPTLASPGPSSQGRRPKPYSLRLKPFTAVDSPDVEDLHIGSHQTGLDVVFKTEPLSESGLEQDSEAVMLKEQWASGVEAGGVVREIKAEQMCDVCHDSRSLLASQNGLDVSVCSALVSERTASAVGCDVHRRGAGHNNASVCNGCGGVIEEPRDDTASVNRYCVHQDKRDDTTSSSVNRYCVHQDKRDTTSSSVNRYCVHQNERDDTTSSSVNRYCVHQNERDDTTSSSVNRYCVHQDKGPVNGCHIVHSTVSVSGMGDNPEPVPLNVTIKTEPDDVLSIGMGLLSSSTHNLGGVYIQGGEELCTPSSREVGLKNGDEETLQAELTERKKVKKEMSLKSLQCPQCPSTFPCPSHLKRHLLSHREDRHFTCSVCQARFKLLCHLKQHSSTHTGDRPYCCQDCPATFRRSDHLKQHMQSHKGIRPYLCTLCDTSFTQAGHLRKHMIRHRDDRKVVCKVKACKAVFTSVRALQEHRKKHEEDRRCKECNVVLSRADDMKKHMRVHTEDKPYQCPLCPAQFRQAGHLSTHQLQHTDSKPFACDQCGCGFKQSHHLKRHLRVHQGQGCLSCPLCSASFERESSLTRHRQKCHKSAASGATT